MAVSIPCSDRQRLRDLLEGVLPDDEQAELTRHLDTCTLCQRELEGLAGGDGSWPGTTPWIAPGPLGLDTALRQAMGELTDATAPFPDEVAEAEDGVPGFLAPSDRPDALGRFGPYEVLEVTGRGGMGIVLKAFDPSLERLVAIKVLAPQLATSPAARRRFQREARAAARVRHEHVVAIHAVESSGGLPYLVMEYVPGESLQQRLDRDGPLPLEEVLRIGAQTAEGLAAAHAGGLIHRDVKPANILLEEGSGRVRLTDFGLARAVDDATMTQSGYLAGTPQYMAPEQARGEPVDHRADLFSLGSVLYAMSTGRPPFHARTTLAVLRRVSDHPAPPASGLNPNIPDWLVAIMNRLHAKDPAQRFPSAAAVAVLLRQHQTRLQTSPPAETPTPRTRPRRRRRLLLALPALLLATLIGTESAGLTQIVNWAATVLRVRTPEGTLRIEVSDPNVKVTVDGGEVTINGAGLAELHVRVGNHKVQVTRDGETVHDELVHVTRDGREVVKVTLERGPGQAAKGAGGRTAVVVEGHRGAVRSVVFSPDGKLLATGGDDKSVRLLDVASGKVIRALGAQAGKIASLMFFPDGKVLAVLTDDGTLKLWDVTTGKELGALKVAAQFRGGSLQPAGKTLATLTDGGVVRLWNLAGGQVQPLWALPQGGKVRHLAFSPDGRRLVTGSQDGATIIWDAKTGKEIVASMQHKGAVRALAFSPDGKFLASSGADATVRLWDPQTGKELRVFHDGAEGLSVVFSPDGKRLATATGKAVKIWDVRTGKKVATLDNTGGAITCLAFSPDGRRLAAGNADGSVRLWDLGPGAVGMKPLPQDAETLRKLLEEERRRSRELLEEARKRQEATRRELDQALSEADAARLQTAKALYASRIALAQRAWQAGESGRADQVLDAIPPASRAWEWHYLKGVAAGGRDRVLRGHEAGVTAVAFSPDGKLLASGGNHGAVLLSDLATGKSIRKLKPGNGTVTGLAFSPDGKWLASGGGWTVTVWDPATGEAHARSTVAPRAGPDPIRLVVAFSPDGSRLAMTDPDGGVQLWSMRGHPGGGPGKKTRLDGNKRPFTTLAFSPDGKLLAAGGGDRTILLYDLATGKLLRTLTAPTGSDRAVAFTPDGKRLLSADSEGTVRVWDAASGKEVLNWRAAADAVLDLAVSPDGRRVATADGRGLVHLWDPSTGKEVLNLRGPAKFVLCLAFSPDGRLLAGGSADDKVYIWSAAPVKK